MLRRFAAPAFVLAIGPWATAHADWPIPFGSPKTDEVVDIVASPTGDLFVTGHFAGIIETEGGTVISEGLQDIFVARISQAGEVIWLRSAGSDVQEIVHGLTLDDANNVYIVGDFSGSVQFGSNQLMPDGEDGFVAKIDPEGTWQWARAITGANVQTANAVVPLPGNPGVFPQIPESVLVAGSFECGAAFGDDANDDPVSISVPSADCFSERSDIYLARFTTSTGKPVWAERRADASGAESATHMVVDGQSLVLLAGTEVVGGVQEEFATDFETGLQGWVPDNSDYGVSKGDPASRLSGSRMLGVRGSRTGVNSPAVDARGYQKLIVSMEIWRGTDYPDEEVGVSTSVSEENWPCIYNVVGWQCRYRTVKTVRDTIPGSVYSARPFSNQDFRVRYKRSDGSWRTLETFAAGTPGGERFDRTGGNSYVIEDDDALHSDFRLRVELNAGAGADFGSRERCTYERIYIVDTGQTLASASSCSTESIDVDGWVPWWHVDNVTVESLGAGQPYLLEVSNVLDAAGPAIGSTTPLDAGLRIDGLAIDQALSQGRDSLIVAGTRRTDVALGACGSLTGSGMFVASLARSGLGDSGLGCNWIETASGGAGAGTGGSAGDVTVDGAGNVYVTGSFLDRIEFTSDVALDATDQDPFDADEATDVFIARYSKDGLLQWATGGGTFNDDESDPDFGIPAFAGGTGDDAGLAIATDGVASLFVGGRFESVANFGPVDSLVAAGESDGFVVNLGTNGRFFQEQAWIAGVPLAPPENAAVDNVALPPDFFVEGESFDAISARIFSWTKAQGEAARLIPLQPFGSIEVRWRIDGEPPESDARVTSLGSIAWPNQPCDDELIEGCYQVHVIGAPVEAEPATGNYKITEVISPASGSSNPSNNAGLFTATRSGTAAIVYVNGPTLDPVQYPTVVEIVRTLPYTAVPLFVDGVDAEIGQPIVDPFHNEPNRNGFVVNELAYYDGDGPNAAYNRANRTGSIIPVNRYSSSRPQDQGRELAVAWYRANAKGVFWPAKAVRYAPRWPYDPPRIIIASEQGSEVLGQPSLDPQVFPEARLYIQNEFDLPGYNPNDEHAVLAPSATGSGDPAIFALRSDFGSAIANDGGAASDPYALLKYFDESVQQWRFRVYRVDATGGGFSGFRFSGTAATQVAPPYPLSIYQNCGETFVEGQAVGEPPPPPFFQDYTDQLWAESAGSGSVHYFYPGQPGFFVDIDNNDENDLIGTECVPWLARLPVDQGGTDSTRDPIRVGYEISWPDPRPLLTVGETLLTPKRNLPDIFNQAAVEVVYDELQQTKADATPADTLAQLIDPLNPRIVYIDGIPDSIATQFQADGTESILGSADGTIKLPVSIRQRLRYDPINKRLLLTGVFDESGVGEPFLLLNVLSKRDRVTLKTLNGGDGSENETFTNDCLSPTSGCNWDTAVEALFRLSRNPQQIKTICLAPDLDINRQRVCNQSRAVTADDVLVGFDDPAGNGVLQPFRAAGVRPALTAGAAQGTGKMTIAFNNDASLAPLPITMEVIEVGCLASPPPPDTAEIIAPYQGQINVLAPENIFDEQLVLRHSGDFGGNPDDLEFQWFYKPDQGGGQPRVPPDPENGQLNGWIQVPLDDPFGANEISIEGANIRTLSDNWYYARYLGLPECENEENFGPWAGGPGGSLTEPLPQLAEGWVKRVQDRLNPFEARVQDFAQAATNNYASMLIQLGERYEGPVALNNDPENLNSLGLIEAYTTVMRRALQLSVDGTPPVNYGPANNAILFIASRIVEFYTLLGNEAFADAQDPTIGITTDSGAYLSLAPSIFNFQNQLASLLDEELALLRGRDRTNGTVRARPVYNRLFWNFTRGDGEIAYAESYDIDDQDVDGVIDEFDARIQFPQGHGDAWGHYLTANKIYYDLLRHPFFSWDVRTESVGVAGAPIEVDFEDERQFAETSAAKAATGAEIVDLTYRSRYVEDPAGQYQGYTDTDPERAWGLSEWGRRAGMGAYFDWVTANSVLPAEDTDPANVGIRKIDRTTIRELGEIASHYSDIQGQVDEADAGLNPLGLATGVVPFDIDVAQLDRFNTTQFEQVADRAIAALQNAVNVWDYANELNNQIRRNQNTVEDLRRDSAAQENDFSNQLIQIFGYPYSDDIGPGGTYPAGYNGPDMYNYMLVDVPVLAGTLFDFDGGLENRSIGKIEEFTGVYRPGANGMNFFNMQPAGDDASDVSLDGIPCGDDPLAEGCALGELDISGQESLEVTYTTIESPDIGLWFTKPPEWTGQRRAPGKLQQILQQMLQARIALRQSMLEYDRIRLEIEAQIDTLQATFDVTLGNLNVAVSQRNTLRDLTIAVETMKGVATVANGVANFLNRFASNTAECIPDNFVAGLAVGGDVASPAECAVKLGGDVAAFTLESVADGLEIAASATDASKEDVQELAGIRTQINDANLDLFNVKGELDALLRREPIVRAEVFARTEAIKQLVGDYQATLAEGLRVYDRLLTFRRRGAASVQEYRFQDMAFRIFRNDALQKYRAAFDLAARYVYLAASAYDYETNLLGGDSAAGREFLTDIVRQRNLGQLIDGEPLPGTPGLADSMAQLKLNFDVLRGQMGFNNPQIETNRFSLRRELFRIPDGPEGDELWRQRLEQARVDDLWAVPEFRQYARPFAPRSAGPQPGLVLEFTTNVTFGLNFFGWELGPGDSSYDSSQFATRIRSVGTWFADYAGLPLAETPRIYMFPSGADVLRSPSSDNFETREWQIVDQAIPIPFPIAQQELERFDWLPDADTLSGSATDIRRYGRFPAFHFTEPFDDSQVIADSRLVGRSVWNRRWVLIIPGGTFLADPDEGLETFINGRLLPDSDQRDGDGIDDILIFFKTYAYSGL
jgi:hypothetical protein